MAKASGVDPPPMDPDGPEVTFEITAEPDRAATLLCGFSRFGLAGLTAADYLVDHLEMEPLGHVTAAQLPTITPFENGVPRHHTRLFSREDLDVVVLVNELFVPIFAADALAESILAWTDENDIGEVAVLSGVPVAHGPDDHRVFYVASEDYRTGRLDDVDIPAMGNGFLDGVNASLLARGMDTDLRTGVLLTPVHAQAPDVDAALRLIDAFESVYGLDVDSEPLEAFAKQVQRYYQELASRLETLDQGQMPEDRMYM